MNEREYESYVMSIWTLEHLLPQMNCPPYGSPGVEAGAVRMLDRMKAKIAGAPFQPQIRLPY